MGLLSKLLNKQTDTTEQTAAPEPVAAPAPAPAPVREPLPEPTPVEVPASVGLLNLQKNQILDLTKVAPSLCNLRVAAGWDVAEGRHRSYDLDVAAYLCNAQGNVIDTVYFGSKVHNGIFLDKDNLTGDGEGDDETITVALDKLNKDVEKIVFAVVIYDAESKKQTFAEVRNAYTRVLDDSQNGKEICRFELTENGGDNTAVITAELIKNNGNWMFRTIGSYSKDSIKSLARKV